jgi:hypothetical protein
MGSGTHRAAKEAWLMSGTAVIAAGALGVGAAGVMRAEHIAPWTVTIRVPAVGHAVVPAVEAGAGFIAAAVAVCIVLVWYSARKAARQKRWRDNGPVVLHGESTSRVSRDATAGCDERLAELEHGFDVVKAEVGTLRAGMVAIGEGLIAACEHAGQEAPELPDLEEPPTAPVFQLIQGGEAG